MIVEIPTTPEGAIDMNRLTRYVEQDLPEGAIKFQVSATCFYFLITGRRPGRKKEERPKPIIQK